MELLDVCQDLLKFTIVHFTVSSAFYNVIFKSGVEQNILKEKYKMCLH